MDARTDDELLAATRAQPEAFAVFYRRHVAGVIAYFARRTRCAEIAADLAAETFAAALDGAHRHRPDKGPAVGWLYGIARRQLIHAAQKGAVEDRARKRLGMNPVALTDEGLERVEALATADATSPLLREGFAALPADQREAVLARVLDEDDYDAIARRASTSEAVIRKRVSRGLTGLRQRLGGQRSMSDFERALEAELIAAAHRRTVAARKRPPDAHALSRHRAGRRGRGLRRSAGAGRDRHRHAFRDHGPAVLGAGVPPRRRFLHLQPLLLPQPMKQLLPLAAAGLVLAACGGVPGNSVATVDGEPIAKTDYDHWNTVVRKLSPGIKPGDARNQALQVLVSFRWVDGEAERLGVKVSDADVRKSFAEQKQQAFPKEADYQKFLKDSTQTEADIVARVRVELLGQKIQEQVVKGNDQVSDKAIADFYAKNKARFAQPEKRDLRVVLTKSKREADKAHAALERGDAWTKVAKRYSIDDTSKATGGKLPAQAKGTLDADLDKAVFSAAKGELAGPVKTQYGYYVFTRHERRRALAADARGGQGDDQADARVRAPAEGAHRLHHGVHQALAREDRMRRGLQDVRLLERAESRPRHPRRVCNNVRMYAAA